MNRLCDGNEEIRHTGIPSGYIMITPLDAADSLQNNFLLSFQCVNHSLQFN